MSITTKAPTDLDASQATQQAFNDVNSTIGVDGFLVGKVGRQINLTISTTTIANDTETYAFSENSIALYTLQIIYTDGTRSTMLQAKRTA